MIDVRNATELLSEGKIPQTRNVPLPFILRGTFELSSTDFKKLHSFQKPIFTDEIVILCKIGKRALRALRLLARLGYMNLKVYLGGIEDWRNNGGKLTIEGKIIHYLILFFIIQTI